MKKTVWHSCSCIMPRLHPYPTVDTSVCILILPTHFTQKIARTLPHFFWYLLGIPWWECIILYKTSLLLGVVPSFLLLSGILRFIHFLFQDERALPKGDFFPPERPQQLPRKCLNYYSWDFEFIILTRKLQLPLNLCHGILQFSWLFLRKRFKKYPLPIDFSGWKMSVEITTISKNC